jgi:hypothetical protein
MNQRDENWGQEDDPIVRRLRDEKPEASPLELDRMKMAAMAKAKPSRSWGASSRSRIVTALLTVGVMAGGTAGTVAATSGSTSGVSAARAEYKPCDRGGKEDRELCRRLYCFHKFVGREDREHCVREAGLVPFPNEPKTVVKVAPVHRTHVVRRARLIRR